MENLNALEKIEVKRFKYSHVNLIPIDEIENERDDGIYFVCPVPLENEDQYKTYNEECTWLLNNSGPDSVYKSKLPVNIVKSFIVTLAQLDRMQNYNVNIPIPFRAFDGSLALNMPVRINVSTSEPALVSINTILVVCSVLSYIIDTEIACRFELYTTSFKHRVNAIRTHRLSAYLDSLKVLSGYSIKGYSFVLDDFNFSIFHKDGIGREIHFNSYYDVCQLKDFLNKIKATYNIVLA